MGQCICLNLNATAFLFYWKDQIAASDHGKESVWKRQTTIVLKKKKKEFT